VPPTLSNDVYWDEDEEVLTETGGLRIWLRTMLVAIAAVLITVFSVAIYLNPYTEEGDAMRMETHRQLGLPECTFKGVTGKPCPSCGMTTSFALLIRGDVWNSIQANFVGTGDVLLAVDSLVPGLRHSRPLFLDRVAGMGAAALRGCLCGPDAAALGCGVVAELRGFYFRRPLTEERS
jgi:hypothetical protein